MKRFLSGFLSGAIIFGAATGFAVSYIANPVDFKVMVNGKEFVSNPPALEVDGRTYLPLRAMGDALGVPVNWNEELRQAEVGVQAPVAEEKEYSRNNPAPINTIQTYTQNNEYASDNHTVNIRIMETIRGEKAWEMLYAANMFNEEPEEGYEYILVKVAMSVMSVQDDNAFSVNSYEFETFSSNNEEMPAPILVEPEPQLTGKLYAGGSTEGWIAVMVKKDDANPKIAYGLDYNGAGGIWFALQ